MCVLTLSICICIKKQQLLDPRVGDFNVRTFLSLVQADGYNPLNVATSQFLIRDHDDVAKIVVAATGYDSADLTGLLKRPFRPGDLFQNIEKKVKYLYIHTDYNVNYNILILFAQSS
jgi:hypothetical protein